MKKIITMIVLIAAYSIPAMAQRINITETDTTTMRAPANSAAIYTGSGLFSKIIWNFKVASINTTVAVALQKKTGNSEWTSVWADSLVYTKNGNYALEYDNAALSDSLRFKWISESGGTAALITHNARLIGGN